MACIFTGGVHRHRPHDRSDLDVGEAVEGGHLVGDVLVGRAVVPAEEGGDQIGRPGGGGHEGDFGPARQGLPDLGQLGRGHGHPQEGPLADADGIAGQVHVEGGDT